MNISNLAKLLTEASENPTSKEAYYALAEELEKEPELADAKLLSKVDAKPLYIAFPFRHLADWLLRRSKSVGAEAALNNLQKYVDSERIPYSVVAAIGGVRVKEKVSLSEIFEIIPYNDYQSNIWKTILTNKYEKFEASLQPQALIVKQCSFRKKDVPFGSYPIIQREVFRDVQDARLCMTLIGPCSPVLLGEWIELEDWIPQISGSGENITEIYNIGGVSHSLSNQEWNRVIPIFQKWLSLAENEQKRLRVALKRLNSALRKNSWNEDGLTDWAIDLGIALESIFVPEKGGEINFTFSVRAARFFGLDKTTRRETAQIFASLYELRSRAVHNWTLEKKKDKLKFKKESLLRYGSKLAAQAIERMIIEGYPDWDDLIQN